MEFFRKNQKIIIAIITLSFMIWMALPILLAVFIKQ